MGACCMSSHAAFPKCAPSPADSAFSSKGVQQHAGRQGGRRAAMGNFHRAHACPELLAPVPYPCSAAINRYGFNSAGVDAVRANLIQYRRRLLGQVAEEPDPALGLVGVNLGKNRASEDAAADYCLGVSKLGPYADFIVINVSSPNTPGGHACTVAAARGRVLCT